MMVAVALSFSVGLAFILAGLRTRATVAEAQSVASALVIASDYQEYAAPQEDGPGWLSVWTEQRANGLRRSRSQGGLSAQLEAVRFPLRSSEAIAITIALTLFISLMAYLTSGSLIVALIMVGVVPFALRNRLLAKLKKRRRALEEQLPEALAVLSSSLRAGHTLHRAIAAYAESGEAPLSDEFRQIIAETHLGNSIVDAVNSFADRTAIAESAWLARAISIQYSVGGKLADLLDALADITYGRQELSREVAALTAEGRASAWMLGMLPPGLLVMIHFSNPGYLDPMYRGWGLIALLGCGLSIVIGVMWIQKMVDFED